MTITVAHVDAVHSAAHKVEERAEAAPKGSGRELAAREAAGLLREAERHLLELVPEEQRAPYLIAVAPKG